MIIIKHISEETKKGGRAADEADLLTSGIRKVSFALTKIRYRKEIKINIHQILIIFRSFGLRLWV